MVDNRSAGVFGVGGGFNFKSGDVSGTAAKSSDEKNDQGTEYFAQQKREKEQKEENHFVDRSAQLRASLNSLAAMNAANIKIKKIGTEDDEEESKGNLRKRPKKGLLEAENEYERHK